MGPRTKRGSPDGGLRMQALVRIVDRWRRLSGAMNLSTFEGPAEPTPRGMAPKDPRLSSEDGIEPPRGEGRLIRLLRLHAGRLTIYAPGRVPPTAPHEQPEALARIQA